MTEQKVIKLPAKNKPCPCGSGKKYKKCCFGKDGKETMMNTEGGTALVPNIARKVLKNTFREEAKNPLAGIPEDELLRRDQFVMSRQLLAKKKMVEADRLHFERIMNWLKALRIEISSLPVSAGQRPTIDNINKQLDNLQAQHATLILSRQDEATLSALLEVLRYGAGAAKEPQVPEAIPGKPEELSVEGDQIVEDSIHGDNIVGPAAPLPVNPNETPEGQCSKPMKGDSVIKTEGGDSLKDDFDDEDTV